MFLIEGVYSEKFYPQGQISRMKNAFKMELHSEKGVLRFIDEQKPFAELKITNILDNKDMTKYFMEKLNEGQTQ